MSVVDIFISQLPHTASVQSQAGSGNKAAGSGNKAAGPRNKARCEYVGTSWLAKLQRPHLESNSDYITDPHLNSRYTYKYMARPHIVLFPYIYKIL